MASHCCVKALREGERIGIFPYVKRSHHPKLSGVAQGSKRKVSSHAYQNACLEKDENERSSKFHLPFLIPRGICWGQVQGVGQVSWVKVWDPDMQESVCLGLWRPGEAFFQFGLGCVKCFLWFLKIELIFEKIETVKVVWEESQVTRLRHLAINLEFRILPTFLSFWSFREKVQHSIQ